MLSNNEPNLMERLNHARAKREEHLHNAADQFPLRVLPMFLQDIILRLTEMHKFPLDYITSAMLHAAAVAIGNTYWTSFPWKDACVLNMALVGPPGANKSYPLQWAYAPLKQKEEEVVELLHKTLSHEEAKEDIGKEELKALVEEVHFFERLILGDITIPALVENLKDNRRGQCINLDELSGLFSVAGKGQQLLMSFFSRIDVVMDRKKDGRKHIKWPFVPIIGTMQQKLIKSVLSKGNRLENGFAERMLWVLPKNVHYTPRGIAVDDGQLAKQWKDTLYRLLNLQFQKDNSGNLVPNLLAFGEEAKQTLLAYINQPPQCERNLDEETIVRVKAKMDTYVVRFTIVLQLLKWACGEAGNDEVDAATVRDATVLADYFTKSAHEIWEHLSKANPLDLLPADRLRVYQKLPEVFTTASGVATARDNAMAERTFKYWLANDGGKLFTRVHHGKYRKRYIN